MRTSALVLLSLFMVISFTMATDKEDGGSAIEAGDEDEDGGSSMEVGDVGKDKDGGRKRKKMRSPKRRGGMYKLFQDEPPLKLMEIFGARLHFGSIEEEDDEDNGGKSLTGSKSQGKVLKNCRQDPPPMMMEIFGITCEAKNCTENAPKCIYAMTPSPDICEIKRKCTLDQEVPKNPKSKALAMKMKSECITKSLMEAMDLEYKADDYKANSVAMMNMTISESPDLNEETKTSVISAINDDDCVPVPPGSKEYMKKKRQFLVCLMKICVDSMAEK